MNNKKYNEDNTLDSIMKELLNRDNEEIEPFDLSDDPFSGAAVHNEQQELDLNWWQEKQETYEEKIERLKRTYMHEDLNAIINDLKRLHPELLDENKRKKYGNVGVELRPLCRLNNSKAVKSMVIFNFCESSLKKLENWYNANVKNKGCCVYFSIACFFPKMKTKKANGTNYTDNRINSQNQFATFTLMCDFDHITEEENIANDNIFKELEIPFDSVRTSENGWQKRFYLTEPCYDKEFSSKFTKLLLSRGFNADPAFSRQGQIARPIGSINNKCFALKYTDRANQFKVNREIITYKKNNIMELWNKISSLPIVDSSVVVEVINPEKPKTEKDIKEDIYEEFDETYKDVLSESWLKAFKNPMKHMFMETGEGYTNEFLMYIVPHIKNYMKFSREEFILLMNKWAEVNNYSETQKYVYIWDTYSHKDKENKLYPTGKYTDSLAAKFGYMDFKTAKTGYEEAHDINIKNNEDKVVFNLKTFNKDIFRNISNNAIKMFVLMNFEFKDENKTEWTQKELIKHSYLNLSKPTVIKCLAELQEFRFINCQTTFTTKNNLYIYRLLDTYILPFTRNVTLGFHEAQRVIRELTGNEIKAYLLLKSLTVMNNDAKVKYDIKTLGAMLGLKNNGFTHIAKSLADKKFIKINNDGFMDVNEYVIYD